MSWYFSPRLRREVIVFEPQYWVSFWLDWSPAVIRYVERPTDPADPKKWLADFWVEMVDGEFLMDVRVADGQKKGAAPASDPWLLGSSGVERPNDGAYRLSLGWMWARRTLLLNLEQAHPYAVAAFTRGGLKTSSRQVLERVSSSEAIELGELLRLVGGNTYTTQCALFGLAQRGELDLDWSQPLSLRTHVMRARHAP